MSSSQKWKSTKRKQIEGLGALSGSHYSRMLLVIIIIAFNDN